MVLKQPDINLANQLLADWWLNNSTVTTLEFKDELRREYPDHNWTQQWTSWYLGQTNHSFEDNGTHRIYYRDSNALYANTTHISLNVNTVTTTASSIPPVAITLDAINKLCEDYHRVRLTKEAIKKYLKERNVTDFSNFDTLFEDSTWAFTGKHTSDNKKIYVAILADEYFSQSKQEIIPITTMSKPHLRNTLKKRYGNVTLYYLLNNQGDECFKLLKQYCK